MNVKFRILWFEDTPDWLEEQCENIEELLAKYYLIPDITTQDGEDFDISLVTSNEYDLILMDFSLAEGERGDRLVKLIRGQAVLTDILFYSTYVEQMHKAITDGVPDLDGIYITKRDIRTFNNKVEGLIKKIIRRSEDIVNLRGFVLDNTSDFENRISELLAVCYKKLKEEERIILENKMKDILQGNLRRNEKNLQDIEVSDSFFFDVSQKETWVPISAKLPVLQEAMNIMIDKYGMPESNSRKSFQQYYMNAIGTYRNKLGHTKAGDSQIIVCNKTIPIDEKLHNMLRKNVNEVNKEIEGIELFLKTVKDNGVEE